MKRFAIQSPNGFTITLAIFIVSQFWFVCCQTRDTKTILVLGNSITFNGPAQSVGWNGSWGMAATVADSDFVHILRKRVGENFVAKNIAAWESDFDYSFENDPDSQIKPDVLILRLGENVKSVDNYYEALQKLTRTFPAKRVIVTGTFWPMYARDSVQQKFALDHGYSYVSLKALWWDPVNQAIGQFENGGVAAHPSNTGMRKIAESILPALNTK